MSHGTAMRRLLLACAAGAAVAAVPGCFLLAVGGLVVPSPNGKSEPKGTLVNLSGDLIIPNGLTQVTPLNNTAPLNNTTPLSNVTPLVGNAGAGLVGNAGAGLIGNAGGGLVGNSGGALAGAAGALLTFGRFGAPTGLYRVMAASLPSNVLAKPEIELIEASTGKVLASQKIDSAHYDFRITLSSTASGLIVQAFLKQNDDVYGFFAAPIENPSTASGGTTPAGTTPAATADLSLGSTVAAFTLAQMAGVDKDKFKLGTGFRNLGSLDLDNLAAGTKGQKVDLTAVSNVVVASPKIEDILGVAGSLSREVAAQAKQKAQEAATAATGGASSVTETTRQTAAVLSVLNKLPEVVAEEGNLGKTLERVVTEIKAADVLRAAELQKNLTGPSLQAAGDYVEVASAADRARPALTCSDGTVLGAWQSAGTIYLSKLGPQPGERMTIGEGSAPALAAVAGNVLFGARLSPYGGPIAVQGKNLEGEHFGSTYIEPDDFDPDRFAIAGASQSALLAFDGGGFVRSVVLSASGSQLTSAPATVSAAPGGAEAARPAAAAFGDTYLVVWDQADGGGRAIMGRLVSAGGHPQGDRPFRIYPPGPDGAQRGHAAVAAGSDGFLVTWVEERNRYSDLAALRLTPAASPDGSPFDVANAPFDQRNPAIAWTGGRFVVAWDDRRSGRRTVGARIVTARGRVGEELPLNGSAGGSVEAQLPGITACGGYLTVAWTDQAGAGAVLRAVRLQPLE